MPSGKLYAPFTPDKIVNQRPKSMQKDDYQHPDQLLGTLQSRILQRIDQHPNPEDEDRDGQQNAKKTKTGDEFKHACPSFENGEIAGRRSGSMKRIRYAE